MEKDQLKKQFIIWLIVAIVWWLSPVDDVFESAGGPLLILDEIGLSSVAIYKGLRLFLKTKTLDGAKLFTKVGLQKLSDSNTIVGEHVTKVVTDDKIEKVVDSLGNQNPIKAVKKTDTDIQDMSLF